MRRSLNTQKISSNLSIENFVRILSECNNFYIRLNQIRLPQGLQYGSSVYEDFSSRSYSFDHVLQARESLTGQITRMTTSYKIILNSKLRHTAKRAFLIDGTNDKDSITDQFGDTYPPLPLSKYQSCLDRSYDYS